LICNYFAKMTVLFDKTLRSQTQVLVTLLVAVVCEGQVRPIVLWHGMGDTCCFPFSMGAIKEALEQSLPGVYVYSVMMGSNIVEDEVEGFLGNANDEVSYFCQQVAVNPNLQSGFNAIGFSQGSQFLRAYVERCNKPPVFNLITMGGQHQGVADFPNCVSVNETICAIVEEMLSFGAYTSFVQDNVIQAQYFKDPMQISTYLSSSIFLADINNEHKTKNSQYKVNLSTLNKFVLFKWNEDTVVIPRESEWFGYYADYSISKILPLQQMPIYQEDWIGLKTLDDGGKLLFETCPGNHMNITLPWFLENVITPYLNNTF